MESARDDDSTRRLVLILDYFDTLVTSKANGFQPEDEQQEQNRIMLNEIASNPTLDKVKILTNIDDKKLFARDDFSIYQPVVENKDFMQFIDGVKNYFVKIQCD